MTINKKIKLISFRRSGTHFLLELLKNNFDYPLINDAFHPNFDLHCSSILRKNFNIIYVYRDVRDVMKSLYNFFIYSDWRIWSGYDADFTDISFSDFLHGKVKIINVTCSHFEMILKNPVKAWVEHTKWLVPLNKHDIKGAPFNIKYESLLNDTENELIRLSNYLGCTFKEESPIINVKKVAQTKKNLTAYSAEDMDFLLNIASDKLKELGYKI